MGYVGVIWVFPKIGVPQNGWFMMENSLKMDDLGVPLFLENTHIPFTNHLLTSWDIQVIRRFTRRGYVAFFFSSF